MSTADRCREVLVPDVGDKGTLSIAEIMVRAGDSVFADDPLLVVESGKATLDIVAQFDGRIVEVRVAAGDLVVSGQTVVVLEESLEQRPKSRRPEHGGEVPPARFSLFAAFTAASAPAATVPETSCDLLVIGGGPGGYSAAFRAADLGLDTVLVEQHASLGGVCLNVGCIPSKALLHLVGSMEEAAGMADCGIRFAAPEVDIDRLRAYKAGTVARLTAGLAGMARARGVRVLHGRGRFEDAHRVVVDLANDAGQQSVSFAKCIVAAGSHPLRLPLLPRDERIVDSTGALELPTVPRRMLVVGGGIIGLEMATVYSALGARIDVVELQDALMPGPDRDLVRIWEEQNRHRFDRIMPGTRIAAVVTRDDGVWVGFEGPASPEGLVRYDMILQSVGRKANGLQLDAHKAGVAVGADGVIGVDKHMRTNVRHIHAIGDIVGMPMLAHKALHQAHVAAECAAGLEVNHDGSLIPGVAYTHPEIAWVGLSEDVAKRQGIAVDVAKFPWAASGRAIANRAEHGMTKLLFAQDSGRLLGGSIVGSGAGDMIGEIALAISENCRADDIGRKIHHPHPTLGETIGMAAHLAQGTCTDLPTMARCAR
ncbi:MAG: dihydrolipoyl dehydrogenase [Rhodocyclales bacterium]|nr:dihydrolipoyl dehydrogenase [Rhodocyclales bacterium]